MGVDERETKNDGNEKELRDIDVRVLEEISTRFGLRKLLDRSNEDDLPSFLENNVEHFQAQVMIMRILARCVRRVTANTKNSKAVIRLVCG